jgi:hypothetical protein
MEVVNSNSYRLDCDDLGIHNVLSVDRLSRWGGNKVNGTTPTLPPPVVIEGEEEYVVESIRDSCINEGQLEYLVRWKNYSPETGFTPQKTSIRNTQMPLVWSPLPSFSPSIGSGSRTSLSLRIMDSAGHLGSTLACCWICQDVGSQEGGNVTHLDAVTAQTLPVTTTLLFHLLTPGLGRQPHHTPDPTPDPRPILEMSAPMSVPLGIRTSGHRWIQTSDI